MAPDGPARAASAGGHASPPTARNHVWVYDATQRVMTPTTAEMRELKRRDPVLAKAMNGLPPFPDFPVGTLRGSHVHALARSIIYQQLAPAAAATIYGRVRSLTPGPRFPAPEHVVALSDEELRGAGLSGNKARALKPLAEKTVSGELGLRSVGRLADDEITRRLTTVWGIGAWTTQMFLIFTLGRPDVMPAGDLGVQEGLRILDGLDERPAPEFLMARSEVWRPLRSVAAWFLWRLTDKR